MFDIAKRLGYLFAFLLKSLPPGFSKQILKYGRNIQKSIKSRRRRRSGAPIVTRQDVADTLRSLGLKEGVSVFVHSSLSSLGNVTGGADAIIDALVDVVGPSGTLIFPCFPITAPELLQNRTFTFDVVRTPSRVGLITETARRRQGARRSLHPTHSVAVLGPNAEEIVRGHEDSPTPFGPNTPFQKLLDLDGYVLCIGVTIAYITLFHVVEDSVPDYPLPVYLEESIRVRVVDENGHAKSVWTKLHNPAVSACRLEKKPEVERAVYSYLSGKGIMREYNLGGSRITIVGARQLVRAMIDGIARGITIYDMGCVKARLRSKSRLG